jgi:hypothetical protein
LVNLTNNGQIRSQQLCTRSIKDDTISDHLWNRNHRNTHSIPHHQCLTEITKIRHKALAAHELAQQLVMCRNKGTYKPFKLGDSVWLDSRHLNIPYESNKLKPKRVGPFKIVKTLGEPGKEVLYELDLPHQWRCHPVFNTVLLSPYRETGEHGPNYLKPPPDLINGENEYEVGLIIAH